MWAKVEEILEDIRPILNSVGADAKVVDVLEGVVTLELTGAKNAAMSNPIRLREFVEGELREEIPEVSEVIFEEVEAPAAAPEVRVDVVEPPEDSDTCVFTLSVAVGGADSALYASAKDAQGNELAAALFSVPHVDSLMVKDKMIILSRNGGTWAEIVSQAKNTILGHFGVQVVDEPIGPVDEEDMRKRIEQLLETEVNPSVAAHGGFIELVDVKGPDIWVLMGGGCQGCGMAAVTLRQGVEQAIRRVAPEVRRIFDATAHDAGENPYYAS